MTRDQPVTDDGYREMLLRNVLPTVRSLWPSRARTHPLLQHDNAPPNAVSADLDIVASLADSRVLLDL